MSKATRFTTVGMTIVALVAFSVAAAFTQTLSELDRALHDLFGVSASHMIIVGYDWERLPCPNHVRCDWTPTVVLATYTDPTGNTGAEALFENSSRCRHCYRVLTSGGGAMDAPWIQKFGIDARTAHALLGDNRSAHNVRVRPWPTPTPKH